MAVTEKRYNNVFWFLIDGLRPDYLHISNSTDAREDFFDELLKRGTVFTNVVTAGAGTYTSMHSVFSSLLPSYNGAEGWSRTTLRNFNQEIFTITDYFQLAGYETFKYSDTDEGREVPMSGFKVWESSGFKNILKNTNMTKTERRDHFIEEVNIHKGNKFVYHHVDLLHDLNCSLGAVWNHKDYARNVLITAEEFKKLYREYSISGNDLVIISSDHGVILDKNFIRDGIENGDRQYEESVISFFGIIGKGIAPQILSKPISALDEAPTILHAVLNKSMPGEGISRYDYIKNGVYSEEMFFREKNTFCAVPEMQSPLKSDLFYVRDYNWKYVFGENDPRCEWLINLAENKDYQVNLKDKYPELTKKYSEILRKKIEGGKNFLYKSALEFNKREVKKKFSLVVHINEVLKETIESLLDLGGPYYEIVVCGSEKIWNSYKNYKVKIIETINDEALKKACSGEWIVYIKENGGWSEYFLSDLYRCIQHYGGNKLRVVGKHYVAVKKEQIGSDTYDNLFEKGEVRAIRYPCKKDEGKKYILFGCGKIGKEAVDYLGKENVCCFVDNNPERIGTDICGKRVISFDDLKKVYSDYTIVITASMNTSSVYEIKEQLESNNIYEYLYFDKNE